MTNRLVIVAALVLVSACGSKSPTTPSTTPPASATPTRIISLGGNMAFGNIQVGQSFSATLQITNSGTAPLTITGMTVPAGGVYSSSFTSGTIPAGSTQVATVRFTPASATSYNGTLTVNGDHTSGTNTIAISGTGSRDGLPLFSRSGTGATVFDIPTYVSRVRITGTYTGRCENFIISIAGRLVVNVILGTCSVADTVNYEGTHLISGAAGGVAEVQSSIGINWTVAEVR